MALFSHSHHHRNALLAALLVLTLLGSRWPTHFAPPSAPTPARPESAAVSQPPAAATVAVAAQSAVADTPESYPIDGSGQSRRIRLALDEAVLRRADGKESILPLVPAATRATLPARLAALAAPGTVLPVAYIDGEPRSAATRRVVTRKLRLKIEEPAASQLAASHRLTITDRPSYAPGWLVASAADPFAALAAMSSLRGQPGVAAADVLLATQQTRRTLPNDPLITAQWHLKNSNSVRTHANLETAWNFGVGSTGRGSGIRIGIVDDGLETAHPDLIANVDAVNDKDWNGGDLDPNPETYDDHGTSCAGNAAARANNGIGVAGTAPEATLVGLRLIARSTDDATEAEAMAYRNDLIQVKSNSWGPEDTGTLLEGPGPLTLAALQSATTTGRNGKGTIFLWAGGNGGDVGDNSNYDGYANSIFTIAIGATDSNGIRADYSEPGSNLVVCAPSSGGASALGITTVDRTSYDGYNAVSSASGGDYANDFGGTSSAAPTAAGIVALMLEKNPNLGWRDVQEILVRSAYKFKPTDTGWASNSAGLHFHHDFGAGLIDAAAAVNLAATWTNLDQQTSTAVTQSGLPVAIPDNNATGITRSFDLSATRLRAEHVTVKLNVSHTSRGNLEITLTSPSGMVSRLAETHIDSNNDYANWTFSSVRHWGESAAGTWTLKIADRSTSGNATGGTLTAAELTLFGTAIAPVNPPPLAQITQPTSGQVVSPGASVTVAVTATDLTASDTPGTISQVELLDNNVSIGTDSVAPYSFTFSPATGSHTLVAKATDSEAAVGSSLSVTLNVVNQTPQITAAGLSATNQSYADLPLTVTSLSASDPEGAALTASYQWQASTDGVTFVAEPGATAATLAAEPSHAAKLWRCVLTTSDGINTSPPFTTAAVNLLPRPTPTATAGTPYSYASGLVLRGDSSQLSRLALINEFSQGSSSSAEWVEILTLQPASLRGWSLADNSSTRLTFADSAAWDAIPAGTLIVIYNGTVRDPLLPPDDSDPADHRMILASSNPAFFAGSPATWPSLGDTGDAVVLRDATGTIVAKVGYGSDPTFQPNLGTVNTGQAAYYAGGTDAGASSANAWVTTPSLVARKSQPRAANNLFISEYVEGTSSNKAIELFNPATTAVDLAAAGYRLELYSNGSSLANATLSLTGTIPAAGTFVIKHILASALITAQLPWSNLSFNGDDAVVLKKGSIIIDSFGQVGSDPGTAWTANSVTSLNKTLRRKPAISQGDPIAGDSFDPSSEWLQFDVDTFNGLGSHTMTDPPPALTLSASPSTFPENAGSSAAIGTVTVAQPPPADLTIMLTASDPTAAGVPASVILPAGHTSATFPIVAVDDLILDGSQSVTLTATAVGFLVGTVVLTVTDDEGPTGVTPAAANTPANQSFVSDLGNGLLNRPALFRLGGGAQIPTGLTLDSVTGVLAGTLATTAAPGNYLIGIERYNTLGEVVSQIFMLSVEMVPADPFTTFLIHAGVPVDQRAPGDDPDHDGQSNAIEFALGGNPNNAAVNALLQPLIADSDDPDTLAELLLTIAVRTGTPAFSAGPAPSATIDGFTYTIQGSTHLPDFSAPVACVSPVTSHLPPPPTGYEYRTFSLPTPPPTGFLRVQLTAPMGSVPAN